MCDENIPSRVGKWTALKLEYLDYYLQAYVIATKQSREKHYIDAFSGCGECTLSDTGHPLEGSPWRALNALPPFTYYHFVEIDERLASHLERRIAERGIQNARVYRGDCNEVIPEKILPKIPKDVPSFSFLDPRGLQLNWTTIERLASHRERMKMELLILYPYDMAIARLFKLAMKNESHHATLTRFYGSEKWLAEFKESLRLKETIDQQRERFVKFYTNNLSKLGYRNVQPYGPLYSAGQRPVYHVIFASDHDVGIKIMQDVWSRTRFVPGEMGYTPVKRPSIK